MKPIVDLILSLVMFILFIPPALFVAFVMMAGNLETKISVMAQFGPYLLLLPLGLILFAIYIFKKTTQKKTSDSRSR
jgi:uncharacterized membrane protein (DUF485 family)